MDKYTAQEEAYKRGHEDGAAAGAAESYSAGFADGLKASGIAPIQWRDADDVPLRPEFGTDYLVLTSIIDPHDGERSINPCAKIYHPFTYDDAEMKPNIAFWCPVTMPGAPAEPVYQTAPSRPAAAGDDGSTRADILHAAERAVCGDREKQYGSPEDNFGLIGKLWTIYTGTMITAEDVAMMMGLFKIARIKTGVGTRDSYVDLAGYAACGAEIALK